MDEEELKIAAEKWFKDKEESIALNLRCIELAKLFKAGALGNLKPLWHFKHEDIDFLKQTHQLDEQYLVTGYTVLRVVNFDQLLNSFYGGQGSFISDGKIIDRNRFKDNQLCRIVEHWLNGEALIPPIILYNNGLSQNYPADGNHRMKMAYYLGVKEIPIIVPNLYLAQVSELVL
jgi:hypothetical protein